MFLLIKNEQIHQTQFVEVDVSGQTLHSLCGKITDQLFYCNKSTATLACSLWTASAIVLLQFVVGLTFILFPAKLLIPFSAFSGMTDHVAYTIATVTSALCSLISCRSSEPLDQVLAAPSENSAYLLVPEDVHLELFPGEGGSVSTTSNILRLASPADFDHHHHSKWKALLFLLVVYLTVAVIANLVACYKFIVAWNFIVHQLRLDLSFFNNNKKQQQPRKILTLREAQRTHVSIESMGCTACCICLADFGENELVTSCDDGCHKWFHRECLFTWLDQSDHCPCCRIDMISKKPRGVVVELMELVGMN